MTTNQYGISSMANSPDSPWQGSSVFWGTSVEGAMTSEEATEMGSLDWEVAMKELFVQRKDGQMIKVKDRLACVRRDAVVLPNGDVDAFGVFSPQYSPLQNRDKFKFADGLVANGEAVFHSVGSLKGGAKTWMYLQLPSDLKVSDTDILERGILITDSYDGSSSLGISFMSTRKLCCNTLRGLVGRGGQFRGKHTRNLMGRINEAREVMGLEEAYSQMLMRGIELMAQEAMNKAQLDEFLTNLFGVEEDPEAVSARTRNQMDKVANLFYQGKGNHGETQWDALNAVTEFVDHHRGVSSGSSAERDKNLNSAWFGTGADLKTTAWNLLVPAGAVN